MPEPGRTRPVSTAQVRAYAAKAQEFAEAAASDLGAGRNIASASLAVHAGINSVKHLPEPHKRPRQDSNLRPSD